MSACTQAGARNSHSRTRPCWSAPHHRARCAPDRARSGPQHVTVAHGRPGPAAGPGRTCATTVSAAAEQAAQPAATPAELADQVHGREAQLLEDAGVLVGVDGARQLLVGLLRLGVVALVAEELEDLVLVDLHARPVPRTRAPTRLRTPRARSGPAGRRRPPPRPGAATR